MKFLLKLILICAFSLAGYVEAGECLKDLVGKSVCAPSQGSVVITIEGPACALGVCIKDTKGEWQCSNISGGAVVRGLTGEVRCLGGCQRPTREQCIEL